MMSRQLMMASGAAALVAPYLLSSGSALAPLRAQARTRGGAIPPDPAMAAAAPSVPLGILVLCRGSRTALLPRSGFVLWIGSCRCRSARKQAVPVLLPPAMRVSADDLVASTAPGAPHHRPLPAIKLRNS